VLVGCRARWLERSRIFVSRLSPRAVVPVTLYLVTPTILYHRTFALMMIRLISVSSYLTSYVTKLHACFMRFGILNRLNTQILFIFKNIIEREREGGRGRERLVDVREVERIFMLKSSGFISKAASP